MCTSFHVCRRTFHICPFSPCSVVDTRLHVEHAHSQNNNHYSCTNTPLYSFPFSLLPSHSHMHAHTYTHSAPRFFSFKSTLLAGPAVLECDSCVFRFLAALRLEYSKGCSQQTTCSPSRKGRGGRETERRRGIEYSTKLGGNRERENERQRLARTVEELESF